MKTPGSETVLWSLPQDEITGAEIRRFSMAESDFTVFFRDGSWARLTSSPSGARDIVALLDRSPLGAGSDLMAPQA
ncbi:MULTISPECIES: hypothetical protein [Streptomyces]|uniref:hypothetical protein n=1 Tax=Streptomyces TaxID=1883 RepID=UPI000CF1FF62|nr:MULTISPECIES: hypothetical protein [Streptomyces]PPS68246.1 hypothetical protein BV882_33335 [Streptomyces sp. 46]